MRTNTELYGKGVVVPNVPDNVANFRIQLLKENLRILVYHTHYKNQDNALIKDVQEAIDFWNKLKTGEGI
ncbi:MAG TPA: hypothetical protein EYP60_00435 [bacterium (Candidatus Stahlbacteria)]|nr:hypothetical protein [Candidatus Stahlbacteria bacterium]